MPQLPRTAFAKRRSAFGLEPDERTAALDVVKAGVGHHRCRVEALPVVRQDDAERAAVQGDRERVRTAVLHHVGNHLLTNAKKDRAYIAGQLGRYSLHHHARQTGVCTMMISPIRRLPARR